MRTLILILAATTLATISQAANINSEFPICTSQQAIQDFAQARMFTDYNKMQDLIADGSCTFVEPDIKASVIEKTMYPKVMVFVPYKTPLIGWTTQENLK